MDTSILGGWGRLGALLPHCVTVLVLLVRVGVIALNIAAVSRHTAPLPQLRRKSPEK